VSERAVTDWRDQRRDGLKDVVRRNHRLFVFKLLAEAAKTYLRAYYNENHYRFEHNGEAFVIDAVLRVKADAPVVVFDVGANRGLWSREVLNRREDAEIHYFEIAPGLRDLLTETLRDRPSVRLNAVGLSDVDEVLQLNYVPDAETTSSLHELILPRRWGLKEETVSANVIMGDRYCAQSGVDHIDLLKIDTEGHDLRVLYGFRNMLDQERISVIQFEHGFVHIPALSLLYNFYQYLVPFGFIIGRLYPTCVDFKDYDPCEDEQFRMGNYIAVHESQRQVVEILRGSG